MQSLLQHEVSLAGSIKIREEFHEIMGNSRGYVYYRDTGGQFGMIAICLLKQDSPTWGCIGRLGLGNGEEWKSKKDQMQPCLKQSGLLKILCKGWLKDSRLRNQSVSRIPVKDKVQNKTTNKIEKRVGLECLFLFQVVCQSLNWWQY